MRIQLSSFFLAILLLTFASCKYKLSDTPNWDADYVAPLLNSKVSLNDAIQDTNVFQVNSDNSITLVYRDTVVNFVLSDFLNVPDTSLEAKITLDSIRLSTDSLSEKITLGQLSQQAGGGMDVLLGSYHQSNTPSWLDIPGIDGVSGQPVPIDASTFFQEATLIQGFLDFEIQNDLPVDIRDVVFSIKNQGLYGNTDTIIKVIIPLIPKNTFKDTTISLAGKVVESQLEGQLINLDTDTLFGGTYIDTAQQAVTVKIRMRDLGASSATAVFPGQTVINTTNSGNYDFGPDIALTKMGIASGILKVKAVHTLMDTIEFVYTLPTALKDGNPVQLVTRLDPAPNSSTPVEANQQLDLNGYFIDLSSNGEFVNEFPQNLKGNLLYSGNLVSMDLSDSISVFYGLLDIIPSYVEGYFGKEVFSFKEGVKFDFFDAIKGGSLDLSDPSMELSFSNSIGVDGELNLKDVTAYNTRTGQSMSLTASNISGPIAVPGPRLPNVGQVISTYLTLNQGNSNIRQFISLMPDSLAFDIEVIANGNGDPSLRNNFATDESSITAVMDVAVPLDGMANNLTLESDLDLNISDANLSDRVNSGRLDLLVENYFPFETDVQLYFYNASGNLTDSLFQTGDNRTIPGGFPDQTGLVTTPSTATVGSFFDSYRLEKLRNGAESAKVVFKLSTVPSGKQVKLYSNYEILFKLVGDFNYQVGG